MRGDVPANQTHSYVIVQNCAQHTQTGNAAYHTSAEQSLDMPHKQRRFQQAAPLPECSKQAIIVSH